MKITYDKEADAIYIYFIPESEIKAGIVSKTKGEWPVQVDFSKDDKIVGVEILQASQILCINELKKLKFEKIG